MSLIRTPLAVCRPDPKHRQDCVAFIDSISKKNGIKLAPFDLAEWGRGVESTLIQSNISSRHPRMEAQDLAMLTDHVWETLRSIDPGDFDCSFIKMAFDIRQKHSPFMTFGRTQKFINMLCKYAYCLYWGGMDARWNAQNSWVESLSPFFIFRLIRLSFSIYGRKALRGLQGS